MVCYSTAATNGGYPNNPVLAGNSLNPYSPGDSGDTGENRKDQAGTSSAAFTLNSAASRRPLKSLKTHLCKS